MSIKNRLVVKNKYIEFLSWPIIWLTKPITLYKNLKHLEQYKSIVERQTELISRQKPDGTITFVNNAFQKALGMNKEMLLNKKFDYGFPLKLANMPKPQDYLEMLRSSPNELTLEVHTTEGDIKWFEKIDTALIDKSGNIVEIQSVIKDITKQKVLKNELEENEQKFRNLAETIPVLIWAINENEEITYLNRNWLEYLDGIDTKNLSETWSKYFHTNDVAKLNKLRHEKVSKHEPFELDIKVKKLTDGTYSWMLMKGVPIFSEGIYRGYIGTCIDITQKKKSIIELLRARMHTEKMIKMREEFVANISHEIRTPLNTIVGMLNLLEKTQKTNNQFEYIDAIRLSTDNLLVIIDDILDFAKINAGKVKFNYENVDLNKLIADIVKTIEFKAKDKNLDFLVELPDKIGKFEADPYRLKQILLNLVDNAIKFTEKGYVKISAEVLKETSKEYVLKFKIIDTGIGISENKLTTVFEEFSQVSYEISRKYGGTGLGLSITKKLVDLQNGDIKVTSTVGEGSVFEVTLTFKKSNRIQTKHKKKETDFAKLNGLKILIVEDNKMNQLVLKKLLEEHKVVTTITNNGKEAILQLEQAEFDLILMDIRMDVMDGYETTKYIREHINKVIPIIGVSANAEFEEITKVKKIGMNDYVSKPYAAEHLYKVISKNISSKGGQELTSL